MRGRPAVVAAALCVLLAGFSTWRYRAAHTGPFELWTLHAGMPFKTLDDDEYAATKRRFVCATMPGTGRFCQLHGRRLPGILRLFVDPNDRLAVIQFWPAEDNSMMIDNARKLAAEWTLVDAPVTSRAGDRPDGPTTSLWRTSDKRWSATIQYGCLGPTPTVIELADDAAIADVIARNPDAVAQLAAAHLIAPPEESEMADAPRRAPGECGAGMFLRPSH